MRIFQFLLIFILLSCSDDENFINNFINKNNISITNLRKVPIAKVMVLNELDDAFLKKYNFLKDNQEDKSLSKIANINFVSKNNDEDYTKISRPIYSEDNKYCLLQIIIFSKVTGYKNMIYFLKYDSGIWHIENIFESRLTS